MPVKADIGYGGVLMVGATVAAATVTVTVAGVRSITPPTWVRDMIDATTMDSAGGLREFIPGLAESGDFGFELLWKPQGTADILLETLKAEQEPRLWRVSFPQIGTPAPFISFRGTLAEKGETVPMDDLLMCTVSLKVTGAVTRGTVT